MSIDMDSTYDITIQCPYCKTDARQVKAGLNEGRQRYRCLGCGRRHTPEQQLRGYTMETRQAALELSAQGLKIREIARRLEINHQTAANWIRESKQQDTASEEQSPRVESSDMPGPPSGNREPASPPISTGKRRATIRDVAKLAGVSTATVSSFCNNKGRMGEDTRKRIQSAMDELHYTPNALIRAIKHQRTGILGVLLFGLGSLHESLGTSLTPPLLSGISSAADAAEHELLLYTGWPNNQQRHSGHNFLNGHIDGLLWVAPEMDDPIMDRVASAGLPTVALLSRHVPNVVGYVNADNVGAMHALVKHLIDLGHRRIAYIGPSHVSNFIDRLEGYRQALKTFGLPYDRNYEAITPELWTRSLWDSALGRWLSMEIPPTAIVAGDDGIAAGICESARQRGLNIPRDLSVTGFNDILDAERYGLTTIRQPFWSIGHAATQKLLEMIEGAPVSACRVTAPISLIVRSTTSGPRVG